MYVTMYNQMYADDLVLITPSATGLNKKLLEICERYEVEFDVL